MNELTDEQILEIFKSSITEGKRTPCFPDSQFDLGDLVGKTIINSRKVENPRQYNPEVENPNPRYFDVLEFKDGSILLFEKWGDMECSHLNSYFYNGQEVLYSDRLFGLI